MVFWEGGWWVAEVHLSLSLSLSLPLPVRLVHPWAAPLPILGCPLWPSTSGNDKLGRGCGDQPEDM